MCYHYHAREFFYLYVISRDTFDCLSLQVDDIFGEFEVDDDGFIASKDVIGLFVAGGGEEKKVHWKGY